MGGATVRVLALRVVRVGAGSFRQRHLVAALVGVAGVVCGLGPRRVVERVVVVGFAAAS